MSATSPVVSSAIELVANHLWQSTLCAIIAALLVLAFRHNRAAVRYWIWFGASVKFLVPSAALGAIGRTLGWQSAPAAAADMIRVIDGMSRPFSRAPLSAAAPTSASSASFDTSLVVVSLLAAIWFCGAAVVLAIWLIRWRHTMALARQGRTMRQDREASILRTLLPVCGIRGPVALIASESIHEPGVFGIVEPVILWPRNIGERLDDEHVKGILAHELSHVCRHDNLTAAIHGVVQALFWFHPMVWFIGARLVHEREAACDEAAIHIGSEPQVYAESILKTCQFSMGLPAVWLAGATGSNLKHRIEAIMSNNTRRSLSQSQQLLLATAAAALVVGPIVAGAMSAERFAPFPLIPIERIPDEAAEAAVKSGDPTMRDAQEQLGRVVGRRYEHLRTGMTLEIPDGWTVVGTFPSSDNGEQVALTPTKGPEAVLYVWMVKEPVDPANIGPWLDGAPQQKFEQRHGNYRIPGTEGYRIRDGSVYRILHGPHQGIVAIADYTDLRTNRAMAESMAWIYTEKGRTFFFARVAADDLILLQPQFQAIIDSAVIP